MRSTQVKKLCFISIIFIFLTSAKISHGFKLNENNDGQLLELHSNTTSNEVQELKDPEELQDFQDIKNRTARDDFTSIKPKPKMGITYGEEINTIYDYYKSYVKIWVLKHTRTSFCGGSLIQPHRILTAAHCFEDALLLYVCTGSHICSPWHGHCEYVDPIGSVFIHRGYIEAIREKQMYHDVAVINLKQSMLTKEAKLIELWKTTKVDPYWFDGMKGNVAGCGKTHEVNKSMSDNLLKADQKIIDEDLAFNLYKSLQPYRHNYKVCWTLHPTNPKASSCNGDSGGPLYMFNKHHGYQMLYGLVSFGTADCTLGYPSCFTRVEPYETFAMSLVDSMPFKQFNLQYAAFGGRSIDLYDAFNVRTEIDDDYADEIWEGYKEKGLSNEDHEEETVAPVTEVVTTPSTTEAPTTIQSIPKSQSFKQSFFQSHCGTKKLFKALLDFVTCELKLDDDP